MKSIKVLLVDDHEIVIEGLTAILRKNPAIEIVGQAHCGVTAVEAAGKLKPHVIIMDLKMPHMNGLAASELINVKNPEIKIIAYFGEYSNMMVRCALEAGILGFVDKASGFQEIHRAVESVHFGEYYFCKQVRLALGSDYRDWVLRSDHSDQIQARDREIVQMLANGKTVSEIAFFYNKSPKTIDAKRRKIMNQLGLSNLAELTKYAISEGITTTEMFS